jgi:hypothetical protein
MTKAQKAEQEKYRAKLREILKPGETLYTVLRHVSRSGMLRALDVYQFDTREPIAPPFRLTYWVAKATGLRYNKKREALEVGGCGTDVGFEAVYLTGCYVYPDGFGCIGTGCPSNDHANGDSDYTPHGNGMTPHLREVIVGADHWHKSGGYAIRQRWM